MKKLLALSILMIFTLTGLSQESYSDLIYLKNGNIIKAKLTDQKIGASISYTTESDITTTIQWDEIEKYYMDNKLTLVETKDSKITSKGLSKDSIVNHKELQKLKKQDYIYFRNFDILRGEVIEERPQDYLIIKHPSFDSMKVPYDFIRRIRYSPNKGIKSKRFKKQVTFSKNYPVTIGNDWLQLNNGDTISGVIFQINYPDNVRLLIDGKYRETYSLSETSFIKINQNPKKYKATIYFGNKEKLSGDILEIWPDSISKLRSFVIKDSLSLKNEELRFIKFLKSRQTMQQRLYFNGDYHYLSIAGGFGNSYGYLGLRVQYRLGDVFGIAPHVGIGVYPDPMFQDLGPWYNVGIKVVGFNWLYFDLSYGVVNRSYNGSSENRHDNPIDQTATSFLVGADFFFTENMGLNLAFGKVIHSSNLWLIDKIVYDTGFILKIPIWKRRPNTKQNELTF